MADVCDTCSHSQVKASVAALVNCSVGHRHWAPALAMTDSELKEYTTDQQMSDGASKASPPVEVHHSLQIIESKQAESRARWHTILLVIPRGF